MTYPPPFLFVHEWWIQLRDDLMLAGTLFNCCPETSSAGLSQVENKKFDRAKDALLAGDLPDTPHEIIYGIWFEPQHDYRATVGPIRNNLWLTPLRFTSRRASVFGHIRILRLLKPGESPNEHARREGPVTRLQARTKSKR
jgi:hypothetical protein